MAKGYRGGMPSTGGGKSMNMMKQAQKMQQELMRMQEEMEELAIDPEAVDPEDVEMLQDMVIAAVNEAMRTADAESAASMSKLTGGMNLGGLL